MMLTKISSSAHMFKGTLIDVVRRFTAQPYQCLPDPSLVPAYAYQSTTVFSFFMRVNRPPTGQSNPAPHVLTGSRYVAQEYIASHVLGRTSAVLYAQGCVLFWSRAAFYSSRDASDEYWW